MIDPIESKKRKREWFTVLGLGLAFLMLTWVEFKLFDVSQSLPFVHSIFFFGLVNFNIILFLVLFFFIFRNIVKNFSEKEEGPLGSTIKSKLIAAFVGFSFIPTALLFLVSVFYINYIFDKWFSERMVGVLKSSIEVSNTYYISSKKKNYHFASKVVDELKSQSTRARFQSKLDDLRELYSLDVIEYYPGLFDEPIVSTAKEEGVPDLPAISMEFRQKGVKQQLEASLTHRYGAGDLIRVIVPMSYKGKSGAVVVSSFVPLSLISKMDAIAMAYNETREVDSVAFPLKSIHLSMLALMTLMILMGATWFGFYLAKQLSVPLEKLGNAAERVAKGNYKLLKLQTATPEINQLVSSFNFMTGALSSSERALKEHSKYIEVVLSNVTTGVISVDHRGVITMVNRHAEKLLQLDPKKVVGQSVRHVMSKEHFQIFNGLLRSMKEHNAENIQKEVQINIQGRPVPIQMSLSVLYDDSGNELGKVLVFDDVTLLLNAQRASAWKEVARRIAHEIKNPLTPISLAAQRLQKKFGKNIQDPAFESSTKMIIEQVDDLKNLVNEFSQFARMPKSIPVKTSLNSVIEEALKVFEHNKLRNCIEFTPDPDLPDFLFDPDQIKRVVMNLLDNSLSGIAGQKSAEIKISSKYDENLKIVRVVVKDNGRGIPKFMQDRIFEPYVTTKKEGTGLGLAIVKRTVEDHNGYIRAFPNEPKGTKIIIELPVAVTSVATTVVEGRIKEDSPI